MRFPDFTPFHLSPTSLTPLPGEADRSFRVECPSGILVAKLCDSRERPRMELEIALLDHLAGKDLSFAVPTVLRTPDGEAIVEQEGELLRAQTWVAGSLLSDYARPGEAELERWGEVAGTLNGALADFEHPFAHRPYRWDPARTLESRDQLPGMSPEEREIATHFWNRFETATLPRLSGLRRSVNHNDLHDQNLLCATPARVSGLIDFGDALFTHTVSELAIACAYAGMERADPLSAMAALVRGFHGVRPLVEPETEVLFDLLIGRLLITVATAAGHRAAGETRDYLFVSERPAWALLRRLRTIDPGLARATFRYACGWSAHPLRERFEAFTTANRSDFYPVVPLDGRLSGIDLGVGSTELGHYRNFEDLDRFTRRVEDILRERGADTAVGGYAEVRPVYTTDAYATEGNDGPRWRTTHLGLDFWTKDGTPVRAPLNGRVHSFHFDPAPGSYGATLLLEHEPEPGLVFYTLYGHLTLASIQGIRAGTQVQKGQMMGEVGRPPENGGWPPHLHWQIMLDPLGYRGDFPGVAYPEEAGLWLSLCPDPRQLLPVTVPTETAPAVSPEILHPARRRHLGLNLSVSYAPKPLHVLRGKGQYLYDHTGRRFLDTVNNVAHVGHEHPAVVEAASRQMAVLNTNTRYLHGEILHFAEELAATLPDPLSVVYFVNSGSEANELALRMAAACSGNESVIAVEHGYHGNTGRTVGVSSYKFDGKGGSGAPGTTRLVPLPVRADHDHTRDVGNLIARSGPAGAFLCESILSCGGQIVLPPGYLAAGYRAVREAGGVCIADEVQVGLGRTGDHFWAFELQGVVPDIVTIGKPIGNGHPLGAVVCTPEVAAGFANGMEYFNTFGGNPVSCATGRAVLRVIREEGLQERARLVGGRLMTGLRELQERHALIHEVRGHGLFLGVDLRDATGRPATRPAYLLKQRMRELGFLMSTDGPADNVLKLKPPLCITEANVEQLLGYLDRELGSWRVRG